MERQPSEAVAGFSIFSVANNRMSVIGQMNADLIFSAGQKADLQ